MKWLTQDGVRAYLRANGVSSAKVVEEIISGFDFDRPVYEQRLEPRHELWQFVRNASHSELAPRTGNWFSLSGATLTGLSIFGGGSGRQMHRFIVEHEFIAIEGSARAMPRNWGWSGGGEGGHTQIYVPPRLIGHLRSVGPQ